MLLAVATPPIAAVYVWRTVVLPALSGALPADFSVNYMAAAARIASGQDPYDLCVLHNCAPTPGAFTPLPLAGAQYVTPLPVAWMLQPLLGADPHVQLAIVIGVLQVAVIVFLWTTMRAIGVKDWQLALLLILIVIGFEP
ncbi:MAG TPA: hypothetical protein VGJ79_12780, partial [Candidatus Dormibacteraeota bacterium]